MHEKIQNATKHINIMSTIMGGMGQDLHNMGKEMEYYAAKYHQVEKRVEVSILFSLWHFLKDRQVLDASVWKHKVVTIPRLKLCKHNVYASAYVANFFHSWIRILFFCSEA